MALAESPRNPLDRICLFLATGFGVGYVRFAPGTVGSLWGPPMMFGWQQLGLSPWWNLLLIAGLIILGVGICGRAARLMDVKDPGCVVFDEIAAFSIVFAFQPVDLTSGFLGFLWFRLFDILKPPPVRHLDRLPGGTGIMADDLAAAVYAAVALAGSMWLLSTVS